MLIFNRPTLPSYPDSTALLPLSQTLTTSHLSQPPQSRCYETPGGTILLRAHMDLEGLTMDREVRKLRDEMSRRLAEVVYNGMW